MLQSMPPPHSWGQFKQMVNDEFGLSCEQLEGNFYNLRPGQDEKVPEFIMRVEIERRLLDIPASSQMLLAFKHLLDDGKFLQECD